MAKLIITHTEVKSSINKEGVPDGQEIKSINGEIKIRFQSSGDMSKYENKDGSLNTGALYWDIQSSLKNGLVLKP